MKSTSLNHVYRLVWSSASDCWVAVAENSPARGKRGGVSRKLTAALLAVSVGSFASAAWAGGPLPTGGAITAGSGSIAQSGTQMTVTQTSDKLVTNWRSFDIGSNAGVRFVQPGKNSIALNRVVGGGGPSEILGNLSANGQVWLLNPGGVVIGKGAQVNVGGLVASSLNISDDDFLAGKAHFTGGATGGAVINQGNITAAGGVVALIGPQVSNSGTISTPNGSVAMAAGDAVSLDFEGDGLVSVNVDRGVLNALVRNDGAISADGGSVLLSARAADAAISSVVNNTGVIEAKSLVSRNGRIVLDNDTANGTTNVSGTLDVSSTTGTGGDVIVAGTNIAVNSATINASGATGGGTVKVGGGLKGEDASIGNAHSVTTGNDVNVFADATGKGDGGTVTFWSDGNNDFAGNIFIRGGANGGDGGLAEVSGKGGLHYTGVTNALAPKGVVGDLLLDPTTIEIYGGDDPGNGASSGWGTTGTTGDMKIYEGTLEKQTANVALLASGDITFEDLNKDGSGNTITSTTTHAAPTIDGLTNAYVTGDGMITMQPGVSVYVETVASSHSSIQFMNSNNTLAVSGNAFIYMEAGGSGTGTVGQPQSGGSLVTGNFGVFNLVVGSDTDVTDPSNNLGPADMPAHVGSNYRLGTAYTTLADHPAAGSITLLGADGLAVNGNLTTHGGYVRVSGDADSGGVGNIILSHNITTNNGNLYLGFGTDSTSYALLSGVTNLGSGQLYTGLDIARAKGFTGNSPNTSYNQYAMGWSGLGGASGGVILGGQLIVSQSNLDLTGYTIQGGADIQNTGGSVSLGNVTMTTTDKATGHATTSSVVGLQGSEITLDAGTTINGLSSVDLQLKSENASDNLFFNNTEGVMLGNGTVNRDGTVSGQTTRTTFISETDLAKLEADGVRSLIIGRADGTGTTEVESSVNGMGSAVTPGFTFNVPGELGLINGNIVVNGALSNSSGSVVLQAENARDGIDQLGTLPSAGQAWVAGVANNDNITGNVTITADGTVTAGDDIIASSANGNFVNDRGSDAFTTGGRWLTYSNSPDLDVTGGLTYDFKIYNGNYLDADGAFAQADGTYSYANGTQADTHPDTRLIDGTHTLIQLLTLTGGSGASAFDNSIVNGKVYKVSPTVEATFVGAVTKTYDGTTGLTNTTVTYQDGTTGSALTTSGNVKLVSNGIDGDNVQVAVSQIGLGGAQFSDKNANPDGSVSVNGSTVTVANGKTVSATGVTIGTATNGGDSNAADDDVSGHQVRVYGYNLSGGTGDVGATGGAIQGNIGVINPATVTVSATAGGKVYDGNTGATLSNPQVVTGVLAGDAGNVAVAGTTGTFSDKNVANGKSVYGTGLTLTGTEAGNYVIDYGTAVATADITQKTITATATASDKVYDGTTAAQLSDVTLAGLISGDTVSASGTGSFDTKNVGNGKAVDGSGLSLAGADAGNYVIDTSAQVATAAITPKSISATATAGDKVYDGTTTAQLSDVTLAGLVSGDTVSASGTGSFDTKNVGNGKAVDGSGLSLAGADAGNYVLDTSAQVATAAITPKSISATATAGDKVYDGTTTAQLSNVTLAGLVSGDTVSASGTGSFDTKNVGNGKAVDGSGLSLAGADAGNYVIDTSAQVATAAITPKSITASATAGDKVYDGTTSAQLSNVTLAGLVSGDTVSASGSTGSFDTKNVGNGKAVDGSGLSLTGADAGNYVLDTSAQVATAAITPKTLTASATAGDKVYDGTTTAQLSNVALSGLVGGDTVSASGTGSFDTKNVGNGKAVDGLGLSLAGADAGNYVLDTSAQIATAAITPKSISATATAGDKVYDGTTTAQLSNVALAGLVSGDTVSASGTGSFDTKNVGNGKAVDGSGLSLAGADAGNYVLDTSAQVATAAITPKTLTASATAGDKVYDGTTNAQLSNVTLAGLVGSDTVSATGSTGSFDTKNVGNGKAVDGSGLSLAGADAGNYVLDTSAQVATAAITPKTITVTGTVSGKTYDGTTAAQLANVALNSGDIISGDDLGVAGNTGSFDNQNVGAGKSVYGTGLSLTGADKGNYVLDTQAAIGTGDISTNYSPVALVAPTQGVNGTARSDQNASGSGNHAAGDSVATLGTTPQSVAGLYDGLPGSNTSQGMHDVDTATPVLDTSIVRANGWTSLALGDEKEEPAAHNTLVVFRAESADKLDNKGTYEVVDKGNDIALEGVATLGSNTPDLGVAGGEWVRGVVARADGELLEMRVRLLNDGTLLVNLPSNVSQQRDEDAAGYGLAVARKRLGVHVQAIKAVVLEASNSQQS
ncbi:YDG domain-containing protein [Paraburkholderia sp. ZP32-5]|uniref:YDG domain-containing protein n=1 Tax=Paraburkholderia sp. ZP32-5 TaxID=2883245 RepID=UPI001F18BBD1|nr:YDG domain-containing protein [Paraburkholderia sp. ZP32-5]